GRARLPPRRRPQGAWSTRRTPSAGPPGGGASARRAACWAPASSACWTASCSTTSWAGTTSSTSLAARRRSPTASSTSPCGSWSSRASPSSGRRAPASPSPAPAASSWAAPSSAPGRSSSSTPSWTTPCCASIGCIPRATWPPGRRATSSSPWSSSSPAGGSCAAPRIAGGPRRGAARGGRPRREGVERTGRLLEIDLLERLGRVHLGELGERLREHRAVVAVVEDDVLGLAALRELDDLAVARVAGEVEAADLAAHRLVLAAAQVQPARVQEAAPAGAGDLVAGEEDGALLVVLELAEVVERGPAFEHAGGGDEHVPLHGALALRGVLHEVAGLQRLLHLALVLEVAVVVEHHLDDLLAHAVHPDIVPLLGEHDLAALRDDAVHGVEELLLRLLAVRVLAAAVRGLDGQHVAAHRLGLGDEVRVDEVDVAREEEARRAVVHLEHGGARDVARAVEAHVELAALAHVPIVALVPLRVHGRDVLALEGLRVAFEARD